MRLTCLQKDLTEALSITNKAVDSNNTLPVLNNVLLKAEGKKLFFTTTNLEIAINYSVPADIKNEGEITIPSKLLTNYIGYLKDEKVDISINEGNTVVINTPDSKTKIKGIPASEFPPIPTVEKDGELTVSAKDLMLAINQVVFSASINTTRPILAGVYFIATKDALKLVATDSYRLSEKSLKPKSSSGEVTCIIPAKTMMDLGAILSAHKSEDATVQIIVSKNQIFFEVDSIQITSRLIDGQFPNYEQIIPKTSNTKVVVGTSDLSLILKRVNLFAKENNNKVIFRVSGGNLNVSTDSTQYGEGEVKISVKVDGQDNEIAVNSQFALDALSNIGSNEVVIEIGEKNNPVVIKPSNNSDYVHIIMPLKI